MRKAFDDTGLKVYGAHVGIDQSEKDLAGVIANHKTLGNTNVGIPYLGEDRRENAAASWQFGGVVNEIGKKLADVN